MFTRNIIWAGLFILMMPTMTVFAQTPSEQCMSYFTQKEYKKALQLCLTIANQDPTAAAVVGDIFYNGYSDDKNPYEAFNKAFKYYLIAAKHGDTDAQFKLGMLFPSTNLKLGMLFESGILMAPKTGLRTLHPLNIKKIMSHLRFVGLRKVPLNASNQKHEPKGHYWKSETERFYWILKAIKTGYFMTVDEEKKLKDVFFSTPSSETLKSCLEAPYSLMQLDRFDDGIVRYGDCGQGSITGIDDILAYLDFGGHLFHWISAKSIIVSEHAVKQYNIKKNAYVLSHKQQPIKSSTMGTYSSILEGLIIPGIGLANLGISTYEDLTFEDSNPIPTFSDKIIREKMKYLNEAKVVLKQQKNFIRNTIREVSPDNFKRIVISSSLVDLNEKDLKQQYVYFNNNFVVQPILERTDQLLYIADKLTIWGSDEQQLEKAATVFARLDKGMILNSNIDNRKLFFKVFQKFKAQAGAAQMEMLKAIQDLSISNMDNGGADRWIKE